MSTLKNIADIRREYTLKSLDFAHINQNPFTQFQSWFDEAKKAQILEVNAMHLATTNIYNEPNLRVVLLKELNEKGFVFFTNYESQKGKEINQNPNACINFFWAELERQIRIKGKIEKISETDSTTYFQSRPKDSQLGAWTSPQSRRITSREVLNKKFIELQEKHQNDDIISKPDNWGGYILIPSYFEFWQGRASRLHDRLMYELKKNIWKIGRLAP